MENKKEHMEHVTRHVKSSILSNYWAIAAIVLAVVLVCILGYSMMNKGIGEKAAGEKVKSFIVSQGAPENAINITSIEETPQLYLVNVSLTTGQKGTLSITKDGKYFGSMQLLPDLTQESQTPTQTQETATPTEVPKSDKPSVELFVMSYCPYGTQAEKGILPVFNLLGTKIDGKIRFVHYTMHGEKEDTENFRQLCIRETTPALYSKYLSCFLEDSNATRCLKLVNLNEDTCIANKAKDYYAADSALSNKYGVQGSPTLVINGVEVQSGRDSASMLKTICAAFNTAPAECSQTLSSESPAPGFGTTAASSGSASAASCGA